MAGPAWNAKAGVASFVATCMANAGDFSALAAALAASGMVEIDPADGPQFPVSSPERRRLWKSNAAVGPDEDAYTGYLVKGETPRAEICWHISRPGDSAATALPELKKRYPPKGVTVSDGTVFSYGGGESWETVSGQTTFTIGVNWPFRGDPSKGTSMLYVLKLISAGKGAPQ